MDFLTIEIAVEEANVRMRPAVQIVPVGLDDDNNVVVDYFTPWGIDGTGTPYFDSDGAASGERAYLSIDQTTGDFVLTKLTGATQIS